LQRRAVTSARLQTAKYLKLVQSVYRIFLSSTKVSVYNFHFKTNTFQALLQEFQSFSWLNRGPTVNPRLPTCFGIHYFATLQPIEWSKI